MSIRESVGSAGTRGPVAGFTLIELMVVVAVVAILASIAIPAYQEQIRKSRRAQAKADLVEYMQVAERRFTVDNSYADFVLPTNQSPREANATARYVLAASTQTPTELVLTATAQGPQTEDRCGDLSISNTGLKTESGVAELADCW
ncbi:type IV pilin protein [Pseudoxanthomonas daejeonensis]|uniref:type IV pilin protein n=1 Tax=Pseudoxanthomonas daejeonensis TaxID=266062 RepID=UPI001F541B85|nr:type IV pilin protein [Pseudoxanthomonas daejeonensis]UNK56712.1 type IV pilin protein [Pseudoxanthomonas daejeonensis]